MSEENANEQAAEAVTEVPEEGTTPEQATGVISKFSKWPLAAAAAAVVVAGVGGFAIGDRNDFDGRPVGVSGVVEGGAMMPDGGVVPDGQGFGGHGKGHGKGHGMQNGQAMMPGQDTDGDLTPATPHCHDASGMDQLPGADGLCADGSTPGGPKAGLTTPSTTSTPTPSASATATS